MRYSALALAMALAPLVQTGFSEGVIGASDPRFAEARATLARVMEADKIPSIAVAVAQGDRIIWQEAFGWANREKQIRATPTTAYSLASISKPITATGLMRLVEQERVALDRPVNYYLGNAKLWVPGGGDASGATVRRVLSHTAGLPLHYRFYYRNQPYTKPPMGDTIARYGMLVNPPGTVYQYSNLGYGIVDQIIEQASGRSYPEFLRDEVFRPLGMRQASVHGAGRNLEELAERYDYDGKPIPYYDTDHDGASGVYASAQDLVKFGMFHLGVKLVEQLRVIEDSTRELMQMPQTPPGGEQYGLGWTVGMDRGLKRIWHTGSMPGVTTILNLYPDEKTVTVVLMNASTPAGRGQIIQAVNAAALSKLSAPPVALPSVPNPNPASLKPTAEQLGDWEGTLKTWDRDVPLAMRVEPDGDIKVRFGTGLWFLMNQASWTDGHLTGRFAATIKTPDVRQYPQIILADLRLRDGKLAGQMTAHTPDPPVYFALTSYAELTKGRPAGSK